MQSQSRVAQPSLPMPRAAQLLREHGFRAWYDQQVQTFLQRYAGGQAFHYPSFSQRCGRATRPLGNTQDLLAYNVLYASAHFGRMQALLKPVVFIDAKQPAQTLYLKVFDYGCGQGLATLALLEHLKGLPVVLDVHLVEPSVLALQAAQQYVQAQAGHCGIEVQVQAHACGLDQLPDDAFVLQPGQLGVHLFSNVLDLESQQVFDLGTLARQIQSAAGEHLCLAVSPDHFGGKAGFDRLQAVLAPAECWLDTPRLSALVHTYRLREGMTWHTVQGRALILMVRVGQ